MSSPKGANKAASPALPRNMIKGVWMPGTLTYPTRRHSPQISSTGRTYLKNKHELTPESEHAILNPAKILSASLADLS